jgi:hypothetical protein
MAGGALLRRTGWPSPRVKVLAHKRTVRATLKNAYSLGYHGLGPVPLGVPHVQMASG